jgi:hypothetical protein
MEAVQQACPQFVCGSEQHAGYRCSLLGFRLPGGPEEPRRLIRRCLSKLRWRAGITVDPAR